MSSDPDVNQKDEVFLPDSSEMETVPCRFTLPVSGEGDACGVLIGRTFDCYTIEKLLGKGGMAWVFLARHDALHRLCSIKVLSPDLQRRGSGTIARFLEEARTAASVVHPHIVTVHNIGCIEGYHYIELEYVCGRTLQVLLEDSAAPLDPLRATRLMLQSCSGLAEAHRCGLVHRDFKPSNVLVDASDFAKLADFGLACPLEQDVDMALPKDLFGTPFYMAPELFRGGRATTQSDVYAVGVTFFQLLTNRLPFHAGRLSGLAYMHQALPLPDPRQFKSDLPDEVVEFITQCTAKNPADRPADGAQLLHGLHELLVRLRDVAQLVREAAQIMGVAVHKQGDRLAVNVPVGESRQQVVFIEEETSGRPAEHVVKIFSPCCPVNDTFLRRALELNARVHHGSLAIQDIDGEAHFVMVNIYPRATCDVEEIRHSIIDVSRWADMVETELTDHDRY